MIIILEDTLYVVDEAEFMRRRDVATNAGSYADVMAYLDLLVSWVKSHPKLEVKFYDLDDHI